jgi:sulfur relay (sulfurtransferase) DsrF/TusC family protein
MPLSLIGQQMNHLIILNDAPYGPNAATTVLDGNLLPKMEDEPVYVLIGDAVVRIAGQTTPMGAKH